MVEIYINNTLLDTSGTETFPLNYSIADIRNPEKRTQSFSKTITLPSSKVNDKLFTHAFNVNRSGGYNANTKATCLVLQDNIEVFNGNAQLKRIKQDSVRKYGYEVVIFGKLSNIFFDMGRGKLEDLDFSEFNHDYTKANQVNSWDTSIIQNGTGTPFSLGNGYTYPIIDYGYSSNQIDYKVNELFPALYIKEVWDKIFSTYGYTYTSTFLDSTRFKSLITPHTRQRLELSNAQIEDRLFHADTTALQEITVGVSVGVNYAAAETLEVDDDSTGNNFDNGSNYNIGTFQYTVPDDGVYGFSSRLFGGIRLVPDTSGVAVTPTFQGTLQIHGVLKVNSTQVNTKTTNVDFSNIAAFSTEYESAATIAQPDPDGIFSNFQFSDYANKFAPYMDNLVLTSGDTVELEFLTNVQMGTAWSSGGSTTDADKFVTSGGVYYDGDYHIQIKSGATFYNKVNNTAVLEGGEIDMSNVLPINIEQKDFIGSIIKMFNLYVEQDQSNENNYLIEPRNDFYDSGTNVNLEDKLDFDSTQEIVPMGALDAARYFYSYKSDKDEFNQRYQDTYGEVYGQYIEDVNNDFVTQEKKTEVIFSATPVADTGFSDMVMPRIFQTESNGNIKPYAANIRILYYGGMRTITGQQWNHIDGAGSSTSHFTYPYCGHLDDPFNPTFDLNFGVVREVYYSDLWTTLNWTNANLFNEYYKQFIEEITNENSILFSAMFLMRGKDIYNTDFRNQYWFLNAYWRLNKIIDYDPNANALTKCEFIKIKDAAIFSADSVEVVGAADDSVIYTPPRLKTKSMYNDNVYNQAPDNNIKGSGNIIGYTARSIDVVGDNNNVHDGTERITISGSGNTILGGLTDVTLINSDNLTILESDVTYIDGQLVDPYLIAVRLIQTLTSNGNMSLTYRTTLIDNSSADVTVTLPPAANTERQRFTIKKESSNTTNASAVTVAGGGTIDGNTTVNLISQYDSIELESDGTEYNIV